MSDTQAQLPLRLRGQRRRKPPAAAPAMPARKLTELSLAEVSCVDVPANQGARHLMFKNLAQVDPRPPAGPSALSASGVDQTAPPPAGAPSPGGPPSPPTGDQAAGGSGEAENGQGAEGQAPAAPGPSPLPADAADRIISALSAERDEALARVTERDSQIAWLSERVAALSTPGDTPNGNTNPTTQPVAHAAPASQESNMSETQGQQPAGNPGAEATNKGAAPGMAPDAIAKAVDDAVKAATAELRKNLEAAQQRAEAAETLAKAERDARELVDLTKQAEGPDFRFLPGEPIAKARALGALRQLPEAERATLEAALKAGNAALSSRFREVGKGYTGAEPSNGGGGSGDAEAELDRLAKARAKETGEPYATAYSKAMTQNPEVYSRYLSEQRARVRAHA